MKLSLSSSTILSRWSREVMEEKCNMTSTTSTQTMFLLNIKTFPTKPCSGEGVLDFVMWFQSNFPFLESFKEERTFPLGIVSNFVKVRAPPPTTDGNWETLLYWKIAGGPKQWNCTSAKYILKRKVFANNYKLQKISSCSVLRNFKHNQDRPLLQNFAFILKRYQRHYGPRRRLLYPVIWFGLVDLVCRFG